MEWGRERSPVDPRRAPPQAGQWECWARLKTRAGGGAGLRVRGAVRAGQAGGRPEHLRLRRRRLRWRSRWRWGAAVVSTDHRVRVATAGGRPEPAHADSSLSAWDSGGTCTARGLNTRRCLGPRESPARVQTPVGGCERSCGFSDNLCGG